MSGDLPTVERLASEDADQCPIDGLPCRECPSYCLEIYPTTALADPETETDRSEDEHG